MSKLSQLTDASVAVLVSCCPQLLSFIAIDCGSLTDKAVALIAYTLGYIEVIDLSSSVIYIDAWNTRYSQYTNAALISLLDGCKSVLSVHLTNQNGIDLSDPWFSQVFCRKGHFNLRCIGLRGLDRVPKVQCFLDIFKYCYELNEGESS